MQAEEPNVNTCGRNVAVRGHFYKIPLERYQNIFKKLRNDNYDLDEVITYLSENL